MTAEGGTSRLLRELLSAWASNHTSSRVWKLAIVHLQCKEIGIAHPGQLMPCNVLVEESPCADLFQVPCKTATKPSPRAHEGSQKLLAKHQSLPVCDRRRSQIHENLTTLLKRLPRPISIGFARDRTDRPHRPAFVQPDMSAILNSELG